MSNYSNISGFGSADWLTSAIKKNPEGLLLLAAGCALLLRSGRASRAQASDEYQMHGYGRGDRDWKMREGMSEAADTAREYASSVGDNLSKTADRVGKTVSETADRYVSAAGEYADETRRKRINPDELPSKLRARLSGSFASSHWRSPSQAWPPEQLWRPLFPPPGLSAKRLVRPENGCPKLRAAPANG